MSHSTATTASAKKSAKSTKSKKRKGENEDELTPTQVVEWDLQSPDLKEAKEVQPPPKKKSKTPLAPERKEAINYAKALLVQFEHHKKHKEEKPAEAVWKAFLAVIDKHQLKLTVLYA